MEKTIQKVYRKVSKSEKAFLHEKSRNSYRVEYQTKYIVSGKKKTEETFKTYSYGKYSIIVANLGFPTENWTNT